MLIVCWVSEFYVFNSMTCNFECQVEWYLLCRLLCSKHRCLVSCFILFKLNDRTIWNLEDPLPFKTGQKLFMGERCIHTCICINCDVHRDTQPNPGEKKSGGMSLLWQQLWCSQIPYIPRMCLWGWHLMMVCVW